LVAILRGLSGDAPVRARYLLDHNLNGTGRYADGHKARRDAPDQSPGTIFAEPLPHLYLNDGHMASYCTIE